MVFFLLHHSFPIEIAMIISGLWLENIDDTFQTLVFPTVEDGGTVTFFTLWLRKFLENAWYLLFFTGTAAPYYLTPSHGSHFNSTAPDRWFQFRVWIKDLLKRFFTCELVGSCMLVFLIRAACSFMAIGATASPD